MPRIGSKTSKTFSADAELDFVEVELVAWTLVLGLGANLDVLTIDEIIASSKDQFWVTRDPFSGAGNDLAREIFILSVANIRRLWHRRQIALAVLNG